MTEQKNDRWLVRLTPRQGGSVMDFLTRPMSLDVWERRPDCLVAVASEQTITEIERRRIGQVERLRRTTDLEEEASARSGFKSD